MTHLEAIINAEARLAQAGIDSARLDAECLLAYALKKTRADLYLEREAVLEKDTLARFEEILCQRCARTPIAYITGVKEFWSLPIAVTPDVLIPRPETETLVEEVLKLVSAKNAPLRILDLCTGSGCIAAALATELPAATITATDASAAALTIARQNLSRFGDRVECMLGDLFAALLKPGLFDLIVSNPPYIAERDRKTLAPEILDHEPHAALFAGNEGLDFSSRIIEDAPGFLVPGGWLLLETGAGQTESLSTMALGVEGYDTVRTACDLAGIERVIALRRSRFA